MRPKLPLLGALVASLTAACASGQNEPPPATAAETPPAASAPAPSGPDAPPASGAAEAPSAAPEEAATGGDPDARTMEVIASVVKAHRKDARACYEKGQKEIPDLKGDLVVHFVLTPSGKVKVAELNQERSTIKSPMVVNCVIDVVRAIDFPKSSRGMETTVNYPFNFNP